MKKYLTLLLVILSSFVLRSSAENILTLTNPKTSETDVFRKGSYLLFATKADQSVHEGFIREITDSSLVFDDAQVSLSQIDVLAGSTKGKIVAGKVAAAVANCLIVAGTAVFDCGLDFFAYSDGYYYWPIGGTIWLAGAFVAGLGYAFDWATLPLDHAVRVRNYKGWNPAILKEEKLPVPEKKLQTSDSAKVISPPTEEKPKKEKKEKKNKSGDDVYGDN